MCSTDKEAIYEELRGRMNRKKRKQQRIDQQLRELMRMQKQQQPTPVFPGQEKPDLVNNPFNTAIGFKKSAQMGTNQVAASNGYTPPSFINQPGMTYGTANPMLLDAQRQIEWRQQQAILDIAGSQNPYTPGSMMLSQDGVYEDFPNIPIGEGEDVYNRFFDSYTGCQPGEKPRDCRKRIRVEGREQSRIAKSEAKRLKAEASTILAEQGIAGGGGGKGKKAKEIIGAIGEGAGKLLGGIFGKGGGEAGSDGGGASADNAAAASAGSKTTTYIIIGVVAVLVIGVGAFFLMKKK